MKRTLGIITILALAAGVATSTTAKSERKDQPDSRFVVETLEALGEAHYPEKMKIKRISSIEVGDTYYHIYEGKLDPYGYHIIVFDNYQNYLGYYESTFPPCNYQIKNNIVIDPSEVDEDGNDQYYPIPIDEKKGLPAKITIGGAPTKFNRAPIKEGEKTEPKVATGAGGIVPEYRDWTITFKGKELTVRAIYVKQTFGKVYLKAEASGITKDFDITSLSRKDRDYVEQFK